MTTKPHPAEACTDMEWDRDYQHLDSAPPREITSAYRDIVAVVAVLLTGFFCLVAGAVVAGFAN